MPAARRHYTSRPASRLQILADGMICDAAHLTLSRDGTTTCFPILKLLARLACSQI
jgi:hypothetical protein